MAKIAIDPITRIEGHLRIEAQIDNGKVTDAWSAGTMFRGIELILKDRDPREAWMLAQRICGVCTTVHAICSVRAIEDALGITIPTNARILRNILEATQCVHDHIIHFYHLHALDWVDIVSALSGDPSAASTLQRSMSDWANSSPSYFTTVKTRLQTFVNSGQLGIFANGYWGHPAYRLPPEANLVLAAHYLEALNFQREYIKIHATLGGKNPHPQTYTVGGMAIPLDKTSSNALTPAKIDAMRAIAKTGLDFVTKVYVPDVLLVAQHYRGWSTKGRGVGNFLSFGDYPDAGGSRYLPRGVVVNRDLSTSPSGMDQNKIKEYVAHSWYSYTGGDSAGLHPASGQTTVNFTGPQPPFSFLNTAGKYSFLKTPRYNELPVEVGALARMVVAYAKNHTRVRELINGVLSKLGLGSSAVFSTLGRVAARAVEAQVLSEQLDIWFSSLKDNINAGNITIANNAKWSRSTWPASATGFGATEAPRGALGHWVSISAGKISKYQCIVATQWNGSPRDAAGKRGAFEEALINTPVADPSRPLEILRTIHSFDPCMACAVHVLDPSGKPVTQISNSLMRT
jgi:Ni,Fe-hydrogenase I large subunit